MFCEEYRLQKGRWAVLLKSEVEPEEVNGILVFKGVSAKLENNGNYPYYVFTPGKETWGLRRAYGVHRIMDTEGNSSADIMSVRLLDCGAYLSVFRLRPGDILMICGYDCRRHTFLRYAPENGEPRFEPATAEEELVCRRLNTDSLVIDTHKLGQEGYYE